MEIYELTRLKSKLKYFARLSTKKINPGGQSCKLSSQQIFIPYLL